MAASVNDYTRIVFQLLERVDLLVRRFKDQGAVAVDKQYFLFSWYIQQARVLVIVL